MATVKKPKSTGPKSAAGKAKSSMNALSHGLTSTRVMPDEVQMVEEFAKELTDFYKPESPLEVLQIQRIAFCRAKLARLIDIEWANRELTRKKIQTEPELVMAKLTEYPASLKAAALDHIQGRSYLSQFGLNESILEVLIQEIEAPMVVLAAPQDLWVYYPKLCAFLESLFEGKFDLGSAHVDFMLEQFAQTIRNKRHASVDAKGERSEIDRLLLQIHTDDEIEERDKRKESRLTQQGFLKYNDLIVKDFAAIVDLALMMARVQEVLKSFEDMKDWMLRSVDLQGDEADRMMKYQNMLERRLSTSIGELFELRKFKNSI